MACCPAKDAEPKEEKNDDGAPATVRFPLLLTCQILPFVLNEQFNSSNNKKSWLSDWGCLLVNYICAMDDL